MDETGSLIAGRFEVRRRLGAGGFGIVYEVLDREQQAIVALKTLRRSDADSLYRLKREFRALADIAHPNLITLYELLSYGEHWFFTMELVDGIDFFHHVTGHPSEDEPTQSMIPGANQPFLPTADPGRLRPALRQLASGLRHLHLAGQLHLDLKPSNVLVSPAGRVVILDFGLSSAKGQAPGEGVVMGTPAYMAPERAAGKRVSEAADWYSLGVMLYQALAGRKPFRRDILTLPSALARAVPEDLEALCLALMRWNPEERPNGAEVLRSFGVTATDSEPANVFVGRSAELAALRRTFAAGGAVRVVVHGKSGIGKTALVRRFLDEVDCLVLTGRCYEQEFARYQALDGVVDELSRFLMSLPADERAGILPDDAGLAAMMFPMLREITGPAPREVPHDLRELRMRAFEAIRRLFASLAQQRRVVVFIDDVHWADPDSAPLLAHVMRGPNVFWILCRRTSAEGDLEIPLGELSPEESLKLAKVLAPDRAETVARESGGNPLVLAELARHSEGVFERRIASLDGAARRALEVAAVAVKPVPRDIARRAADLGGAESAVLAQLRGARLLHTREIEVYHDRIRAAVMNVLAPEAVCERHRRLAAAWEQSGRGDPEVLMVHFQGAGDRAKTACYAVAAGERSAAALAFHSAAGFYRVAVDCGAQEARVPLADALANAGRGFEAAEVYRAAAEEGRDVELLRRAASQYLNSGHPVQGLELMREVLRAAGIQPPRFALWRLALRRMAIAARGYSWRERTGISQRELMRIDVCWSLSQGLGMIDLLQAATFHSQQLLLALRAGDPYRVGRALCVEAGYLALAGVTGERKSAELLAEAAAISQRVDNPHGIGLAAMVSGMSAFLAGKWRSARDLMTQAEQVLRERCVGVAWELATARLIHSVALFFLGELRELSERLPAMLASADERGDVYEATDLRIRIAHAALLAQDRAAEAREAAERSVADWPSDRFYVQHWWSLVARTEVHLYAGEADAAWELITRQWPALRRSMLMGMQYIRAESLYHRACAGIIAGHAEGLRQAAKDAARLRRESAPWAVALGYAAEGSLERAAAAFDRADMKLFAAAARWHCGGGDDFFREQGVKNVAAMAGMLVPRPASAKASREPRRVGS